MRKLSAFVFTTLNGFYKGPANDIGWHKHGEEEGRFSEEGANSGSTLLFGRVTYELMASFWPTAMAIQSMPEVARGMNASEKIVFSRTLQQADWNNTRIIGEDMTGAVRALKASAGKDLTILGSGSIIRQLTDAALIDEYQVMIDPVALGKGTLLFEGITRQLDLTLTTTRTFGSGVILAVYRPKREG